MDLNIPIKHYQQAVGHRADWMPDPGVYFYVKDILQDDFGIQIDVLPEHWIPLTIVGTLDWITICGWWLLRNTGIYQSDEPYRWVFLFGKYAFDPDKLMVFRDEPERNRLNERVASPGIEGKERSEALQFLLQDVFEVWWREQRDATPKQAQEFYPPQEFVEVCMYAVFLWVLDTYGRDWIYMQDETFACVFDFGVAYLSLWDSGLLDPKEMVCTFRDLNTCHVCGEKLWCVSNAVIGDGWYPVCNHCIKVHEDVAPEGVDRCDPRVGAPHCPHWKSRDGFAGSCVSTCPHSGVNPGVVWESMETAGTSRVEEYREQIRQLGGRSPRQVAGQTVADVVKHFTEGGAATSPPKTPRLGG